MEQLVLRFLAYDLISGVMYGIGSSIEAMVGRGNGALAKLRGGVASIADASGKLAELYLGGFAALAYGAEKAISQATQLDSDITLLSTHAGLATTQIDAMRAGLLRLAPDVGFTADELAKANYWIVSEASGNITAANSMIVLGDAAKTAQMSHADLSSTTRTLAVIIGQEYPKALQNGTNLTKAAADAAGQLNAAVGHGVMTMDEMNAALATGIIPLARNLGVTFPQVAAAIDTMTEAGYRGGAAGTAIRNLLTFMSGQSSTAAKALQQLGLTQANLVDSLRGPNGLEGTLALINQHLKSIPQDEQISLIDSIFGRTRGGATAVDVLKNLDQVDANLAFINRDAGNFGANWKLYTETSIFQTQSLSASVNDLQIAIGEALSPAFRGLLVAVGPVIMGFAIWASEHPQLIADALKLGLAVTGLGAAFFGLIAVSSRLALLLTSGPGVAFIAITAALVVIVQHFGELQRAAAQIAAPVEKAFGSLWQALGPVYDSLNGLSTLFGINLPNAAAQTDASLGPPREHIGRLGAAAHDATTPLGAMGNAVVFLGRELARFVSWLAVNMGPAMDQFAGWFIDNVYPKLIQFSNWWNGPAIDGMRQFLSWLQGTLWPEVQRTIGAIASIVITDLGPAFLRIGGFIALYVLPEVGRLADWFVRVLWPAIRQAAEGAGAALREIVDAVTAVGAVVLTVAIPAFDIFREYVLGPLVSVLGALLSHATTFEVILSVWLARFTLMKALDLAAWFYKLAAGAMDWMAGIVRGALAEENATRTKFGLLRAILGVNEGYGTARAVLSILVPHVDLYTTSQMKLAQSSWELIGAMSAVHEAQTKEIEGSIALQRQAEQQVAVLTEMNSELRDTVLQSAMVVENIDAQSIATEKLIATERAFTQSLDGVLRGTSDVSTAMAAVQVQLVRLQEEESATVSIMTNLQAAFEEDAAAVAALTRGEAGAEVGAHQLAVGLGQAAEAAMALGSDFSATISPLASLQQAMQSMNVQMKEDIYGLREWAVANGAVLDSLMPLVTQAEAGAAELGQLTTRLRSIDEEFPYLMTGVRQASEALAQQAVVINGELAPAMTVLGENQNLVANRALGMEANVTAATVALRGEGAVAMSTAGQLDALNVATTEATGAAVARNAGVATGILGGLASAVGSLGSAFMSVLGPAGLVFGVMQMFGASMKDSLVTAGVAIAAFATGGLAAIPAALVAIGAFDWLGLRTKIKNVFDPGVGDNIDAIGKAGTTMFNEFDSGVKHTQRAFSDMAHDAINNDIGGMLTRSNELRQAWTGNSTQMQAAIDGLARNHDWVDINKLMDVWIGKNKDTTATYIALRTSGDQNLRDLATAASRHAASIASSLIDSANAGKASWEKALDGLMAKGSDFSLAYGNDAKTIDSAFSAAGTNAADSFVNAAAQGTISWSSATTSIMSDITRMQAQHHWATGQQVTDAWYAAQQSIAANTAAVDADGSKWAQLTSTFQAEAQQQAQAQVQSGQMQQGAVDAFVSDFVAKHMAMYAQVNPQVRQHQDLILQAANALNISTQDVETYGTESVANMLKSKQQGIDPASAAYQNMQNIIVGLQGSTGTLTQDIINQSAQVRNLAGSWLQVKTNLPTTLPAGTPLGSVPGLGLPPPHSDIGRFVAGGSNMLSYLGETEDEWVVPRSKAPSWMVPFLTAAVSARGASAMPPPAGGGSGAVTIAPVASTGLTDEAVGYLRQIATLLAQTQATVTQSDPQTGTQALLQALVDQVQARRRQGIKGSYVGS